MHPHQVTASLASSPVSDTVTPSDKGLRALETEATLSYRAERGPQGLSSLRSFAQESPSLLMAEARLEPSLQIPCSSFYALIVSLSLFFFSFKLLIILI